MNLNILNQVAKISCIFSSCRVLIRITRNVRQGCIGQPKVKDIAGVGFWTYVVLHYKTFYG